MNGTQLTREAYGEQNFYFMSYFQFNFKWIKDLNMKYKGVKPLE